jgi:hypothetical protein
MAPPRKLSLKMIAFLFLHVRKRNTPDEILQGTEEAYRLKSEAPALSGADNCFHIAT